MAMSKARKRDNAMYRAMLSAGFDAHGRVLPQLQPKQRAAPAARLARHPQRPAVQPTVPLQQTFDLFAVPGGRHVAVAGGSMADRDSMMRMLDRQFGCTF